MSDVILSVKKVLVFDKYEEEAIEIASMLEDLKYTAKQITNIKELPAIMESFAPDVVILDIDEYIQEKNSQYAIQLKQAITDKSVELVFISEYDSIDRRIMAVREGSFAYLPKPLNANLVREIFHIMLPCPNEEKFKILIVDDDEIMTAICTKILEANNFKVKTINSPGAIFSTLNTFEPDVIVLDMYMPIYSGGEIAMMIRQHHMFMTIPIVFISGEEDLNIQLNTRAMGADDYLKKPFKAEHLIFSIIYRARRYRYVKSLISKDGLTGLQLFNKIKGNLNKIMRDCLHKKQSFCCCILDIDHFKKVNDNHGHLFGDKVIRSLSETINSFLRDADICARYGGEEFVIFFPNLVMEKAGDIIAAIKQSYNEIVFTASNEQFNSTFSAGISIASEQDDLNTLIKSADDNLYEAKNSGRNKIVME